MAEAIASACRGANIKYQDSKTSWTRAEQEPVVVHVGSKERLKDTLRFCQEHRVPLIHASTGQDDLLPPKPKCPIIMAPNCAAPIVAMVERIIPTMKVLQDLGMTVKLSELHQESKADKPSGTALVIAKKLGIPPESIRAERIGTSPRARHKLTFKTSGLEIELLMKAKGRRLYAIGALTIAKNVSALGKRLGNKKHDVQQMLGI